MERHLWRPSTAAESVAQDHVQLGFDRLQGWRCHSLSGQPLPGFDPPSRGRGEVCFLVFKWDFMCFNLCHCLLPCRYALLAPSASFHPIKV